jgi:hypothetical protein
MAAERSLTSDLARDVGRNEAGGARHASASSNRRAARQDDPRASLCKLLPVRVTGFPVAENERRGEPELDADSTDDPRRRIRSARTRQRHRFVRSIPHRDHECVVPTGEAAEVHPVGTRLRVAPEAASGTGFDAAVRDERLREAVRRTTAPGCAEQQDGRDDQCGTRSHRAVRFSRNEHECVQRGGAQAGRSSASSSLGADGRMSLRPGWEIPVPVRDGA